MINIVFSFIIVAFFVATTAHVQENYVKFDKAVCTSKPPLLSYHIHVLFWQNNQNSTNAALKLQQEFMKEFGLDENDKCQFEAGDIKPRADLCYFGVNFN